jgi:hypothetical protein
MSAQGINFLFGKSGYFHDIPDTQNICHIDAAFPSALVLT